MWIWADPLGTAIPGSPGPDYVFQTKFLLEFDPELEWIEIRGIWGADNSGEIKIDGHPFPPGSVSGEVSLPQGPTTPIDTNFTQPHQFSISAMHFLSLSKLVLSGGWHTLQVTVHNEGTSSGANPAGFNLSGLVIVKQAVNQAVTRVPAHPVGT